MSDKNTLENVVDLSMSSVEVSVTTANILSSAREVQGAATSMASAVEELAASIGEIEVASDKSNQSTQETAALTNRGMAEMVSLRSSIATAGAVFNTLESKTIDLQSAVSSLGDVVELISRIAGQTNLLALNATIEAARAGEQGKGFAVVANEVKSLSRQTREATDQIQTQINELNLSFADVLTTVAESKDNMAGVIDLANVVNRDFEVIQRNSDSVSSQIGELAHVISQQREAVELLAKNMIVVKDKGDSNLESVSILADQTDQTVSLIEKWRSDLAGEEIENKVLYLAKADHLLWKKRLLDMAVGRSTMKSSDLASHMVCRLGKWYYDVTDEGIKSLPSYKGIEAPHKDVHENGIQAAKCFEEGKLEEGLQFYARLEKSSAQVIASLNELIRDVSKS